MSRITSIKNARSKKASRQPLSQKIRFEVFKRDSFTCQYCGKSAPEIILQVDHINPVANGGENDLMNLITSCTDCNAGKGKRLLDDNKVLEKQRKQLEELNERRLQLEMMLAYREELAKLDDYQISQVSQLFKRLTGCEINENGEKGVRKWLKKFSVLEVLEAVEISASNYLKTSTDGTYTHSSIEMAFDYIPRICYGSRREKEFPEFRQLLYIRGILKKRFPYTNLSGALAVLEKGFKAGLTIDVLMDMAKLNRSWLHIKDEIYRFNGQGEQGGPA